MLLRKAHGAMKGIMMDHGGKVYHQSSPVNFLAVAIPKQTCASCMNLLPAMARMMIKGRSGSKFPNFMGEWS
jgi:hypothetical protein